VACFVEICLHLDAKEIVAFTKSSMNKIEQSVSAASVNFAQGQLGISALQSDLVQSLINTSA